MQRQSLGSPVSKLHSHGGVAIAVARDGADDAKRRIPQLHRLSSSSISISISNSNSNSSPRPEMWIHVIPLLTVFCFLVLYLCSHVPSQTDLAFDGFNLKGAHVNESIGRLSSDFRNSAVRSLQSKLSRKLGHFP